VTQSLTKADVVSSEAEALILVDSSDQVVGYLDKSACHDGDGVLHRAFSLFIFNSRGELLLQQRAAGKRLWGGFWSNSCCSHPRRGETMDEAVARRLEEELGLAASLEFIYKFEYSAAFGELGSERELCWVYLGQTDAEPVINTTEIDGWRWISPAELSRELEATPERYTPWLALEWQRLTSEYSARLPALG
jgi:isopentenyl-diphosphate delta-isomerase